MSDTPNDGTIGDDTSGRRPAGWAAWNQDEGDAPTTGKRPLQPTEQHEDGDAAPQP